MIITLIDAILYFYEEAAAALSSQGVDSVKKPSSSSNQIDTQKDVTSLSFHSFKMDLVDDTK